MEITASDYESIKWISGGKVLHEGKEIRLNDINDIIPYVRAKLYGAGDTVAGTQPFGIKKL